MALRRRRTETSEHLQERLGGLTKANNLMAQGNFIGAAERYQQLGLWESAAGAHQSEAQRLRKEGNVEKAQQHEEKAKILLGRRKP